MVCSGCGIQNFSTRSEFCLACSSARTLVTEFSQEWGSQLLRNLATDIALGAARQVRALRIHSAREAEEGSPPARSSERPRLVSRERSPRIAKAESPKVEAATPKAKEVKSKEESSSSSESEEEAETPQNITKVAEESEEKQKISSRRLSAELSLNTAAKSKAKRPLPVARDDRGDPRYNKATDREGRRESREERPQVVEERKPREERRAKEKHTDHRKSRRGRGFSGDTARSSGLPSSRERHGRDEEVELLPQRFLALPEEREEILRRAHSQKQWRSRR